MTHLSGSHLGFLGKRSNCQIEGGKNYIVHFTQDLLERELYSTIVTTQIRVLPQENFWNLWSLKPFLVASETTYIYTSIFKPYTSHHLWWNVLWSFCANRNLLVFVHKVHMCIRTFACMYRIYSNRSRTSNSSRHRIVAAHGAQWKK